MSRKRDPRRAQGKISGSTDPYGENDVLVDATDALLLDGFTVSLVGTISKGLPSPDERVAMEFQGRINQTQEHISVMVLTNADGAAGVVSQLLGLASRAGFADEFVEILERRMEEMPK